MIHQERMTFGGKGYGRDGITAASFIELQYNELARWDRIAARTPLRPCLCSSNLCASSGLVRGQPY